MPDLDSLPEDPTPVHPEPAGAEPTGDAEPTDDAPPPRDISGLIGPTLLGMVVGVAVILLILWLS